MTAILIFLAVWSVVCLSIILLVGRYLGRRPRPHSSLTAELPATRAAAEGSGAHPVSAGHSASPSAEAPPPDVSRLQSVPPHLHRWWANGIPQCLVCGEWLDADGDSIAAPIDWPVAQRWRDALAAIATNGCSNGDAVFVCNEVVGPDQEQWCSYCIARNALSPLTSSTPVSSTPGVEAARPRDDDRSVS